MRKVIVENDSNVIKLSQITNESIIGINDRFKNKGFIIEQSNGTFSSSNDLSFFKTWSCSTKRDYIEKFLATSKGKVEFFEFKTVKELFKWLSE